MNKPSPYPRCAKCHLKIKPSKSAFALLITKKGDDAAVYDIVRCTDLTKEQVAVHLNGDSACGERTSAYMLNIRKALGISSSADLSFVDRL